MAQATLAECSDDELVTTIGQLHALESATRRELLRFVAEYDRREAWYDDGARNMADWLLARFGMEHRNAVDLVRVAAALENLPEIAATLAEGRLGYDQTSAVSRFALAETDAELAKEAPGLSAAELRARARRENPPTPDEETNAHRRRSLKLWWTDDRQFLHLSGLFPAIAGSIIEAAIDRVADGLPPDARSGLYDTFDERRADGLELLASSAIAADADADRATVVVHVDWAELRDGMGAGEFESGANVSMAALYGLACDATVEFSLEAQGVPVGVGRKTRTVPRWLVRQLRRRDHGCRYPGCARTRWLHAHHIVHWAHGGATNLDNLVLVCSFHHRAVHRLELHVEGNPSGEIHFVRPDGSWIASPAPPALDATTKAWLGGWFPPIATPART